MLAVLQVILLLLDIVWWLVIVSAILSWLYAFNVVNARTLVDSIGAFLYRTTEPMYRPIRRALPNLGGIDLSPLVVLVAIFFLQQVILLYVYPAVLRAGL